MLLQRLYLKNIRSYVDQTLEFPEGKVLLSGDIGAGKSTVLLAIEFSFFGTKRGELSGEALLRKGEKEGIVRLEFSLDNKNYIVERKLKRAKTGVEQTNGVILVDGVANDLMPIEMRAFLLDVLGYPKELLSKSKDLIYRYTVFCPQEEMKSILADDDESRLETLRKVFGIDKYKKVRDNLSIVGKELRTKQQIIEGIIASLPEKQNLFEQKNLQEKQLREKLNEIKNQIFSQSETVKKYQKDYDELQKRWQDLSSKNKEKESLIVLQSERKKNVVSLQDELRSMEKKTSELNVEMEKKMPSYLEVERQVKELQENIGKYQTLSSQTEERKKSFLQQQKQSIEKINDLETKEKQLLPKQQQFIVLEKEIIVLTLPNLENLEKQLFETTSKIKEHELIINSCKKIINEISSIAKCPLCLQNVDSNHKHQVSEAEQRKIDSSSKVTVELQQQLKKNQESFLEAKKIHQQSQEKRLLLEKLRIEVSQLENIFEEKNKNKTSLNKIKDDLVILENQINELAKQDISLKKKELEQKQSSLLEIKLFEQKQKQFEENKQRQVVLKKQFDEISSSIKETDLTILNVEKLIQELPEIERKTSALKSDLERNKELFRKNELNFASSEKESIMLRKEIDEMKKIILELDGKKSELDKMQKLRQWSEEFMPQLAYTIEKAVFMKVYNEFNVLFKEWFSMLLEDETMSVRIDDSFAPIIEQNGHEIEFSHLSGGEKTSCALSYRLALNKVVNEVVSTINTKDIIILDEPTDGFSAVQLDKIRDVLDNLGMRQTILVSHEAKIESFVDHVLKISKKGHESALSSE